MKKKNSAEIIPNIKEFKMKAEQKYIVTILNSVDWHITQAAQLIGINRSTLFRKMKKYGITKKSHPKLISQ